MKNKHWISKEFNKWLYTNKDLFNNPPTLVRSSNSGSEYKFKNITSRLSLWVDDVQFIIMFGRYDIIADLDVILVKSEIGTYSCKLCIKPRKEYNSKRLLLEEHCFLPLARWANKNLTSQNSIIVTGEVNAWSSVEIIHSSDILLRKKEKYFRFSCPLVLKNAGRNEKK